MDEPFESVTRPFPGGGLGRRVLQGIGLALGLTVFRLGFAFFHGELGSLRAAGGVVFWFLALSAGGAAGGVVYYYTEGLRARGGWRKTLANVLALLAYALLVFGALLLLLARAS